jgi:hypothetical protein
MPRVAYLAGHLGHVVVAQERQRDEVLHELGVPSMPRRSQCNITSRTCFCTRAEL